MPSAVVEAAAELAEMIEAHADEAEQARRLPPSTVSALVDADLLRMCVPSCYGGPEVDPVTMVEAIANVAHADGAAGLVLDDRLDDVVDGGRSSRLTAARRSTAIRTTVTGGVFAPNGTGERHGRRRRRLRGHRPMGVGERHAALRVGARRRDV